MQSEVIKQGISLRKAGIYARRMGEYLVAADPRERKWISIHEDDVEYADFAELEKFYSCIPRDPDESPQQLAYRAAEVRATWDEETEIKRQQSNSFFGSLTN